MRDPVLRPRNAVPLGKKTAQDAFAPEFHPRGWRFPAGIRQAQIFRALFSEESGLGRQGCKAFFQECLHSDIGFRYEIDAPLMADSVGMGMIGVDDGAAFLDDGKGLQGQW